MTSAPERGTESVVSDLTSLSSYDFFLPTARIAQTPAEPRDASRLLVVDRARGTLAHRNFRDLPEYLGSEDFLVANNTRVMKARLLGNRLLPTGELGGKIEMLLLDRRRDLEAVGEGEFCFEGAFHSSARQAPGLQFRILSDRGESLDGELIRGTSHSTSGTVVARFPKNPLAAEVGKLPLPHYIERDSNESATATVASVDEAAYQTIYAKGELGEEGSAAAPTAGLHFTQNVLENLKTRGARWSEVTLHVGLGTFRPVKTEDVRSHVMHEERYWVSDETAESLNAHRQSGGKVLAVGTTSVRTLESAYQDGIYRSGSGSTSIFIYPGGREIRAVDRLLTNFHLPKSTLLMLVSAFGGRELIRHAYEEAVRLEYRFFSYGDAMLIL